MPELLARRALLLVGLGRLDEAWDDVLESRAGLAAGVEVFDRAYVDAATTWVAAERGVEGELGDAIEAFAQSVAEVGDESFEFDLEAARARLNSMRLGVEHAVAAFPAITTIDPTSLVNDSYAKVGIGARADLIEWLLARSEH